MVAASWGCTYKMAASRPRSFLLGEAVRGKKIYRSQPRVVEPYPTWLVICYAAAKGQASTTMPNSCTSCVPHQHNLNEAATSLGCDVAAIFFPGDMI
jgi:hypothetical protein